MKALPLYESLDSTAIVDIVDNVYDMPEPWIIEEKKRNISDLLMVHLNINSCQNKLDDLILVNNNLKVHVTFLSDKN